MVAHIKTGIAYHELFFGGGTCGQVCSHQKWHCFTRKLFLGVCGGVHVDMFAHIKSAIAYQERSPRPKTVLGRR
jgi:hypothetical protein